MSKWTHSLCQKCWAEANPGRVATQITEEYGDETAEVCCACGAKHGSGIYVRGDPAAYKCGGVHGG